MKKLLLILILGTFSFSACTKEDVKIKNPEEQTIFVRVESVSNSGQSTFSNIVKFVLK